MKVPIMYKSSDLYDAGTDVIYDDESKLQYAPFIYAGVTAKDNGDDDGGDEEGEDSMVVIYDGTSKTINKSFKDLKDAFETGKIVILDNVVIDNDTMYQVVRYYLVGLDNATEGKYIARFVTVNDDDGVSDVSLWTFEATTETDAMTDEQSNG